MPAVLHHPSSDTVFTEFATVSLIDPLSLERIQDPVRGEECDHDGAFDRNAFIEYYTKQECRSFVQRKALWRCPICSRFCRANQLVKHAELAKVLRSPSLSAEATWVYLMPTGDFQIAPPAQHDSNSVTQTSSSGGRYSGGDSSAPGEKDSEVGIPAADRSCASSIMVAAQAPVNHVRNHVDTQNDGGLLQGDTHTKPSREALVWALTRSRSFPQGSAIEPVQKSESLDRVDEIDTPLERKRRATASSSEKSAKTRTLQPAAETANMVTPTPIQRGTGAGSGRGQGAVTSTSTGGDGRSLQAMFRSAAVQTKKDETSSLQQLIAMGFSMSDSSAAIREAKGDLAAAVGILCERTIL